MHLKLTNETGLPKLICTDCKDDILEAYKKFREDFLKVQAAFKLHTIRESNKQKSHRLLNDTEFVQIFGVKEEKNISIDDEHLLEAEKEINFLNLKIIAFDKTNALKLASCAENTTKDDLKDKVGIKLVHNYDEIELFDDLVKEDITKSDNIKDEPIKLIKDGTQNSKLFICDQCGNQFTCRNIFKLHLKRHSGEKECACE